MPTSARYGAFISYSHARSAEVSRGLQKWLQTYAKPWWRWRAVNVFRDETDLTAALRRIARGIGNGEAYDVFISYAIREGAAAADLDGWAVSQTSSARGRCDG